MTWRAVQKSSVCQMSLPWGMRLGPICTEMIFDRNHMKFTDQHRTDLSQTSTPIKVGVTPKILQKHFLPGTEWNFQPDTEMSCMQNLHYHVIGYRGSDAKKNVLFYWKFHEMSRCAQKLCLPFPPSWRWEGSTLNSFYLARNWMKFPDQHRKIIFCNPPSP